MTATRHPPAREDQGHSHRLPGWLFAGLAVIVLGLVGGIVLVSYQAIATNYRLTALERYVAGKGEQRDAENAAQNRRIDDAVCSVLDQLTAGGRLDAVRAQYGCGPGLPSPPPGPATSTPSPSATAPATSTPRATPDRATPRRPPPTTTTTTRSPAPSGQPAAPKSTAPTTPASGPITSIVCGLAPQLCPTT